ncbi:serine/threonine-protein kinase PLK1 [Ischnura elegans]|uniref:serine/threonine-protein kinase PLK1 n=1 Tax=Ischnura elegans TaxID=197161 RepID=UPI001ED898A4|nr:serine/threonine-protein kinase PLK1 [Ischnura elegans]
MITAREPSKAKAKVNEKPSEIPEVIEDSRKRITYQRGRFFGKGGFARCYEITDVRTKNVYAGKIISKKLLTKNLQREKVTQEIEIHRSLSHTNIVGFHGYFEDANNVYIVLELCRMRSLMELHKRRKILTAPEVRYFLRQILLGVNFLHSQRIIHRDLKLGNLFLNDNLEVKIGDFGLATRVAYEGQRKKTLCGTPNYIAPEILCKKGHSYEVDTWSIGCIMYTLLVGKPPFETNSLNETYERIKRCEYHLPNSLMKSAAKVIQRMLHPDPTNRPKIEDILTDDFFVNGYIPMQLPLSCLTMEPRFDSMENAPSAASRKPLNEMNSEENMKFSRPKVKPLGPPMPSNHKVMPNAPYDPRSHWVTLQEQLNQVLRKNPAREGCINTDDAEDPAAQPMVWVSKWVDYSYKYGFGYQLSDDSVGVVFNDHTKLVVLGNGRNLHYIDRDRQEHYYTTKDYPAQLEKKMKLLNYFLRYMAENLLKAGGGVACKPSDNLARPPWLHEWFRSSQAVVMHLTNGTLQINFMDHQKIVLCPLMGAVTLINGENQFNTYRFSAIEQHGCSPGMAELLERALKNVNRLLAK